MRRKSQTSYSLVLFCKKDGRHPVETVQDIRACSPNKVFVLYAKKKEVLCSLGSKSLETSASAKNISDATAVQHRIASMHCIGQTSRRAVPVDYSRVKPCWLFAHGPQHQFYVEINFDLISDCTPRLQRKDLQFTAPVVSRLSLVTVLATWQEFRHPTGKALIALS